MMGLSDVVFFLGWMVTAAMKGGVVVVAMTLVCKFGGIFTYGTVFASPGDSPLKLWCGRHPWRRECLTVTVHLLWLWLTGTPTCCWS